MAEFLDIGVLGKRDPRVAATVSAVCAHLVKRGCQVRVERGAPGAAAGRGVTLATRAEIARSCDLAVVIGGDGTLLNAGRTLAPAGVPIIGINQGRLGFMVDVAPEELRKTLDQVLKGRYVRERRLLLNAEVIPGRGGRSQRRGPFLAINDVVLRNQAAVRMLEFQTWLDDEFISQHRADGIIVSTPTGSTAYALSGGGPVLHPGLEALALVPICPHTLSDRPVVIGSDRTVRIVLAGGRGTRAMCTTDGQEDVTLMNGDAVVIKRSEHALELIHPENYRYFNILRNKLHWGREPPAARG